MKLLVLVAVLSVAVNLTSAQDDGKYRPELYGGDDGKYRPDSDGRYLGGNYVRGRVYNPLPTTFNPVPAYPGYRGGFYRGFNALQQPIAPVISYNGIDQDPYATALSAVSSASVAYGSTPKPDLEQPRLPVYAKTKYSTDSNARILRLAQDQDINAYHYLYQTENGISAEETGKIDESPASGGTRVTGFYEYIGDDGNKYRVDYVADENGFQPRGAHLPK